MWLRLLLPGVPIDTLPSFFLTWATKLSSVPVALPAGTSSISGSVVTRAMGVNCSLRSGVSLCEMIDSVELVPMPSV